MALFILTNAHPENDDVLGRRLSENLAASDFYEMGRGQWLISYNGTSKELTERLVSEKLSLPILGGIFVGVIAGYWGRSPTDMWEWVANKLKGGKGA